MANWNRWGVAAGLAGALVFGTARAQTPGAPNNAAGTGQAQGAEGRDTTGTQNPGERSGWSGHEANRTGSEPAGRESSTPGGQSDTMGGTAGSQGSTTGSDTATGTSSDRHHASAGASASSGKVDKKLQEDVQKIHAANQGEIHMAQMGQQQATSPDVKQYAQTLEQDHQQIDQQLTQTAQTMGVDLEGKGFQDKQKEGQKAMQKLQGKSGQAFDKEYVKMMVKDHERDIKAVQKAAKDAHKKGQTELASTLEQAVAKMQGHLQQAKQLEKTVGKSARGSGSSSTGSGSTGSSSGGAMGGSSSGDMNSGGSMGGSSSGRSRDTASGSTDSQSGSTGSSSTHDTGNTGDTSHTTKDKSSGQ